MFMANTIVLIREAVALLRELAVLVVLVVGLKTNSRR